MKSQEAIKNENERENSYIMFCSGISGSAFPIWWCKRSGYKEMPSNNELQRREMHA
jgi:hypothetical protein